MRRQPGFMIHRHNLRRVITRKHILPQLRSGGFQPLQRQRLIEQIQRRQLRRRRQFPVRQEIPKIPLQQRHLKIGLIVLHNIILRANVRTRLHMIGREASLLRKIRVQANVPPQIHHINQKLLPRSLPPVGNAVGRRSAIHRAFGTLAFGKSTNAEAFEFVSEAILKAFFTCPSISETATTMLGLWILINPLMLAYTACKTGTSDFDFSDSKPIPRSKILNLLSLHTALGHFKALTASSHGQNLPPETTTYAFLPGVVLIFSIRGARAVISSTECA
ncbi:hypothetical protein MIMGU_mgv1a011636mg [Erythranthe guttata]|uniref:Uncharacterized protein n=1 Tax=Erythranthe guttata TaxID=4155 RepID=A0A022R8W5_ERYGU|nr:hypothetical protein MIMGU_mgv1a011636mg [Erythranthe guttata]